MMRFGVCADVSSAQLLAEAGYDYIELSVASNLIPESDDSDWLVERRKIENIPLAAEVYNSFIRNQRIVGPEADTERLRKYVNTAVKRAAQISGEIIVFGSGGAREIPDGFPAKMAHAQMETFLNLCADASEKHNMVVAIEPLQRGECNFINTVDEGAEWTRRVHRSGVRVLADTYHMEVEREALEAIVSAQDVLAHVHTADTNRYAPGRGNYDHTALFHALKSVQYDARVSMECDWQHCLAEDAAMALDHLKHAFAKSS